MAEPFQDFLKGLGAVLDEPQRRRQLTESGWCLVEGALVGRELDQAADCFDRATGSLPSEVRGTLHPPGLDRKAHLVGACLRPPLLGAVHDVLLRPFRLLRLEGRDPSPGFGQQGLHRDWTPRAAGDPFVAVTVLLYLDEVRADNGPTRLVPGTHLHVHELPRSLRQVGASHPEELRIEAPAGSCLVFNAHLLHGGTRNEGGGRRRALQGTFAAREAVPPGTAPLVAPVRAELAPLLGSGVLPS